MRARVWRGEPGRCPWQFSIADEYGEDVIRGSRPTWREALARVRWWLR